LDFFGGKVLSKKLLFAIAVFVASFATNIDAQKVRLRSQITPVCTNTTSRLKFADITADGNIAVQGSYNCRGAFVYDITNPDAPILASHYNPGANQQFLEAIVIGNRGYFGSGTGGGGVHIVDLTNPYSPVLLGIVDVANGNGFTNIHEMVVFRQGNQEFLLENFNSLSTTKVLKIINITNPAAPVFVRDINPTEAQWVHAFHIRGNRMFTSGWGNGSNRGRTEIYDISNIATQAPTLLGFIEDTSSTTAGNSMHSSWSSEDGNYLYSCRETSNGNGDLRVYNITNPAVPLLVKSVGMVALELNAVTPHNPVVSGNYLYVAWYQAGLQVFDISNPVDPKRVGQYDTFQPTFVMPAEGSSSLISEEPWDMICGTSDLQNALPTTYDGNWAVYPFLGQNKILAGDLTYGLQVLDATAIAAPLKNRVSDFDGDGKTDYSRYTPATGAWNIESSITNVKSSTQFGAPTDKMVSGDYDGDGKSDISVFRPSNGVWYRLNSSNGVFVAIYFGMNGDVTVPADYDADGKMDLAVFRPSQGIWYINQSVLGFRAVYWGLGTDRVLTGDYEGDGKADTAVYRNGIWYILLSSSSLPLSYSFGLANDIPISSDFDGDGRTDIGIYRASTGFWYVLNIATNSYYGVQFGAQTDVPVAADYDGDGKSDFAVFRPATNNWYRLNSSNSAVVEKNFGDAGDIPSPAAFNGQ
jgi:hypothetical protein